jgi:hypothetical protein
LLEPVSTKYNVVVILTIWLDSSMHVVDYYGLVASAATDADISRREVVRIALSVASSLVRGTSLSAVS